MKILVLGDIVGRPGRKFVSDHIKTFIKNENISAISSEAVDIEYSVKNPLESLINDKFDLLEQVEHSAYLNFGALNLLHSCEGNKSSKLSSTI